MPQSQGVLFSMIVNLNSFLKNRLTLDIAILLFWFLLRSPGVLHPDVVLLLDLNEKGESTNQSTLAYFYLLKVMTLNGATTTIMIIVQLVMLYIVLRRVASLTIIDNPRVRDLVIRIIIVTPIYGYFATYLHHDIWGICGSLVLFCEAFRKIYLKQNISLPWLLLGTVLSTCTYASWFGAIFFLLFVAIWRSYLILSLCFLVSLVMVSFSFLAHTSSTISVISLTSDIKCAIEERPELLELRELAPLLKAQSSEFWMESQSTRCLDSNWIYNNMRVDNISISEIVVSWLRIVTTEPGPVIKAHLLKASPALPPPITLLPPNRYDLSNSSVSISRIGANELFPISGLNAQWSFETLAPLRNLFDLLAYLLNLRTDLVGWGGAWLLFVFLLLQKQLRSFGSNKPIAQSALVLSPLLACHFFVVALAPVVDARYVFQSSLLGIIFLCSWIVNYVLRSGQTS